MHDRGAIYARERAKQLRDYTGLQFGNITPTDIDGLIEYQNKAYVLCELKYEHAILPYGQKLAFERLTDDLEKSGKPTLFIIATHNIINPKKDIIVTETIVDSFRYKGEWKTIEKGFILNTKHLIDTFLIDFIENTNISNEILIRCLNLENIEETEPIQNNVKLGEFMPRQEVSP